MERRKLKGIADLYVIDDERRVRSSATVARHATQASPATETRHEAPAPDLLASLPPVAGYLKLGNQIVDHFLPQLEPFEQLAYLQLYRHSHGNGKAFCLISMPKLARRTKISGRSLWRKERGLRQSSRTVRIVTGQVSTTLMN
jgi:hypothetical protein